MNRKPDYECARPYRLERNALAAHAVGTFASPEAAHAAARRYLGTGTAYRVVKRLNKSGTKREVVGEGVS